MIDIGKRIIVFYFSKGQATSFVKFHNPTIGKIMINLYFSVGHYTSFIKFQNLVIGTNRMYIFIA